MGGKEGNKHANKRKYHRSSGTKQAVVTLVERDGRARSFHVANVNAKTIRALVMTTVHRTSALMTAGASFYVKPGAEFASHDRVDHNKGEYVRDGFNRSNTAENFFSILKRGIIGTFHHV